MVRAYVSLMLKTAFFSITASDVLSKWMGESEKLLKALLAVAEEMSPSVIFIGKTCVTLFVSQS